MNRPDSHFITVVLFVASLAGSQLVALADDAVDAAERPVQGYKRLLAEARLRKPTMTEMDRKVLNQNNQLEKAKQQYTLARKIEPYQGEKGKIKTIENRLSRSRRYLQHYKKTKAEGEAKAKAKGRRYVPSQPVVNSIAHYERETKGHAEDLEIAKSERDELMKQWRGVGGPSTEPTRKNALAARRSLEQTITNVENSRTARVNEIQDLEAKLKQAQVALERARRLARIAELDRAEIEKRLKEVQPQIEALSAEARRLKDDRQSIRQQIAAEMNRLELQVLEPGDGDKPPVPKPPQREDAIVLPPAQFHQRRRELEEQYRQAYEKSARETEIELELAALAKEKSRLEDRLQTLLTADPPNENEDIERLRRELAIARVELESAQRNALTKLRTVKNKAARIRRKHAEMTGASSKMAGPLVTIATTLLTIKAPLPVTAGTQSHFDALDAVLKVDIRPRLDQLQSGVEKYNSKTGATDENSPAMRDTKFIHLLGEVDGFIRSGRQLDSALRGVETAQKKVADLESRIANRDD